MFNHPRFTSVVLLLMLVISAGCSQVSVDSPEESGVYVIPPDIQLSYENGAPSSLIVELNNNNITNLLTPTTNGAMASGSDIEEFLSPGDNILVVRGSSLFKSLVFNWDVVGPDLHILGKSDSELHGYLTDPSGVVSMTIDGQPATLSGNPSDKQRNFTIDVAESDVYTVETEDGNGYTSTQQYAHRTKQFSQSIGMRINEQGVDTLTQAFERELANGNFADLFKRPYDGVNSPAFFNQTILLCTVKVWINELSWGLRGDEQGVNIDFDILNSDGTDGVMVADVSLERVVMDGQVYAKCPLLLPINLNARMEIAELGFNTTAFVEVLDGYFEGLSLSDTSATFSGFNLDTFLPNFVDNFASTVATAFINFFLPVFIDIGESVVVPVLEDFLSDVPLSLTLHNSRISMGGKVETFHSTAATTSTSNDGSLDLAFQSHFEALGDLPQETLGSRYSDAETPPLEDTTPSGNDYHVGFMISSNLINQALLAFHESGLTTIKIDYNANKGVSYEGLEVIATEGEDEINEKDGYRFTIEPASPPVVTFGGAQNTMGTLDVNDFTFRFYRQPGSVGDWELLFSATLDVTASFEVGVIDKESVETTRDGTTITRTRRFLDVGLPTVPEIKVVDIQNKGIIKLSEKFINNGIKFLTPIGLPPLAKLISNIPIPTAAGYGIYPEEVWAPDDGHLALAGSFVYLRAAEETPEPDTSVEVLSASDEDTQLLNVVNNTVIINFEGTNDATQYRYRLDGGWWSTWQRRDTIQLRRLLGGQHTIEVCSRTRFLRADPTCAEQTFNTCRQGDDVCLQQ